jgi:hypothetical protein
LRDALPSMDSRLPGLRNEGFLATHELTLGACRLNAWTGAETKARSLLRHQGDTLLRALGFTIEEEDQVTSILRAGPNARKVAVAVLLRKDESVELSTPRFSGLSPVSYALAVADRENILYVLISQGSKLRLYPAKVGVGVGRRGRTETYVEVITSLLRDSDAAFLWLLFSAQALVEGGSIATLLEESTRFAGDLADRLRERIYGLVIPRLAEGLAAARGLRKPTAKDIVPAARAKNRSSKKNTSTSTTVPVRVRPPAPTSQKTSPWHTCSIRHLNRRSPSTASASMRLTMRPPPKPSSISAPLTFRWGPRISSLLL